MLPRCSALGQPPSARLALYVALWLSKCMGSLFTEHNHIAELWVAGQCCERVLQVEEQEKELNVGEAAGLHHSTVLKAQERALQERQLELDAARAEMASNVSLLVHCLQAFRVHTGHAEDTGSHDLVIILT